MKQVSTVPLEAAIGHEFQRRELLQQALTHSSFAREQTDGSEDNEQLEFLGDAVLGFVTSQELFSKYPHYQEGELSKLRAHLVSARHLVRPANELQLGDYLRLGRGEEKTAGRTKPAILVDALEAVLAALYLDAGLDVAREFILKTIVRPELARLAEEQEDDLLLADYKSRLQETLHASGRPEPEYESVKEDGPEHKKMFTVAVLVRKANGEVEFKSEGQGASKKRAGQAAAQKAIERLDLGASQPADGMMSR
jgi:ribonuclease III